MVTNQNAETVKDVPNCETFSCGYCKFTSNSTSSLKEHLQINHQKGKENTENNHDTTHEQAKSYLLKSKSLVDTKNLLQGDLATHHKHSYDLAPKKSADKVFRCAPCDKTFASKISLRTHVRHIHGKPSYKCDNCSLTFKYFKTLANHKRIEHKMKTEKLKCETCSKEFELSLYLRRHIKAMHEPVVKNVKCLSCPLLYVSKVDMMKHFRRIHEKTKNHKCESCNKMFHARSEVVAHMKDRHTEYSARKFVCNICKRGYNNQREFDYHNKSVHLGIKEYKCELCDKSYVRKEKGLFCSSVWRLRGYYCKYSRSYGKS